MFETNPLDEKADQRLRIESQPLEIVYDAVNKYLHKLQNLKNLT